MNLDHPRQRAEKSSKHKAHTQGARKPMTEYEVQARATREKIARLKQLRLAREEAQPRNEEPAGGLAKSNSKRVLKSAETNNRFLQSELKRRYQE
jgi:hypothetical protein